jgi:hypothetical protein
MQRNTVSFKLPAFSVQEPPNMLLLLLACLAFHTEIRTQSVGGTGHVHADADAATSQTLALLLCRLNDP